MKRLNPCLNCGAEMNKGASECLACRHPVKQKVTLWKMFRSVSFSVYLKHYFWLFAFVMICYITNQKAVERAFYSAQEQLPWTIKLFYISNAVLFPFANLLYDRISGGRSITFVGGMYAYIAGIILRLFKMAILYLLAIPLSIFCFIYLWWRTRGLLQQQ